MIHYSFHRYDVEKVFSELVGGRIDGLVLIAAPEDPLVAKVRGSELPVVAMTDRILGLPSVIADDAAGSVAIAEHLHAKGHRHVLYRICPGPSDSAGRRREAFEARAGELGMTTTHGRTEDWRGAVQEPEADLLMRRAELGITAAVCWGDPSANALLAWCLANGLSVPDDLAIVGFNGIEPAVVPARTLTTVRAGWADVAERAVRLLVDTLAERDVPELTVLPVAFHAGDTT